MTSATAWTGEPSFADVLAARDFLAAYLRPTPLIRREALNRALGLAVGEFALVLALGPLSVDMAVAWLPLRALLGLWLLAISFALWRSPVTA